jgi:hypothetical protein
VEQSERSCHVPQTVVVVPSMTLDVEELAKLKGQQHYEERLLFMLILLSSPKTRVIFVTSAPIHPFIIDYYLQLLPGIPASHARARLELFATYDTSPKRSPKKFSSALPFCAAFVKPSVTPRTLTSPSST